ncbi:MAG TPA: bile acid:sodium symporter [Lacipirellulaceae bacterium]
MANEYRQRARDRYAYLVRRHFLWLLLGCYALAAIWPGPGAWLRQWTWSPGSVPSLTVPLVLLATMLFSAALLAEVAQIRAVIQQPLLVCVATLAVWIGPALLVILGGYLVPLFVSEQPATGVLVGLTLVATMPVANSSTGWTQNSHGNLALSLALVVLSIALCSFVTPGMLSALGMSLSASERAYFEALVNRFSGEFFIVWVIVPTLAGFACRWLLTPRRVALVAHWFIFASAGALLLLNYINAAIALPPLTDSPLLVVFVTASFATALSAVGIFSGWLIARLLRQPVEMRTALLFGLSMKHTGLALVLAASVLANQPFAILMLVLATLSQHLCAAFVQWFLQRGATAGLRSSAI